MKNISLEMLLTISSITLFVGSLIILAIDKASFGSNIFLLFSTALNMATTIAFNRKELKELWDKIFNNDDNFKGGNFG